MTCRHGPLAALVWLASVAGLPGVASAAAPELLHTPGYESPVQGDPDDLLMIAGVGFQEGDRVVYQAMDVSPSHPRGVPESNTADAGVAPVIQRDHPAYALTVHLPLQMQKSRAYRLWVVTRENEWSASLAINDPRPQWVSPSYVYASGDVAGLGRIIRVVGRNLAGDSAHPLEVRLRSTKLTYTLAAQPSASEPAAVQNYAAVAALPDKLAPGTYSVGVRVPGLDWVELDDQKLEVRPDPASLPRFSIDDPAYGGCRPDDGKDDSSCFARAIEAARRAGGGIVWVPRGHWGITTQTWGADGFVIPQGVQLQGAGAQASFILRHGPLDPRAPNALLTLMGHNLVAGLSFSDELRFHALRESRPVIQLGPLPVEDESRNIVSHVVEDIVIRDNVFLHIGRAITDDAGRPITRLFITHNEFGAYSDAIGLPGKTGLVWEPFRIDDSVVRGNRFIPGSYVDLSIKQGVLASGMGAGHRIDFSDNMVDGTRTDNLQDPDDPPGFRAGFFWNLHGNIERMLVSANRISCSGDKVGDGEAIAFDESGNTSGFARSGTPRIVAAGPDWITVRGRLDMDQEGHRVPDDFFVGHWVQIAGGRGFGQTRKVTRYIVDSAASTVTLYVAPRWDIVPGGSDSRIGLQRQYWQVAVVGNDIEQRHPPCKKANLSGPNGGTIVIWTSSADLAVEGNQQRDTDGVMFAQGYSFAAPSCAHCGNRLFFTTALEIRGNHVEGEYDWNSDCGDAGIRGTFGSSPTPESPPPVVGFSISLSHNVISHSDGPRGGGIDIAMTSYPGPPPGDWNFIENLLIFHNELRDMEGPPPTPGRCRTGQHERSGIRLEGHDNVRDTVLYGNRCERVARPLADGGLRTQRICSAEAAADHCECVDGQALQ